MRIVVTQKVRCKLFETSPKDMPLSAILEGELLRRGCQYGEYKLLLHEKYTPFIFIPAGVRLFRTQKDLPDYMAIAS